MRKYEAMLGLLPIPLRAFWTLATEMSEWGSFDDSTAVSEVADGGEEAVVAMFSWEEDSGSVSAEQRIRLRKEKCFTGNKEEEEARLQSFAGVNENTTAAMAAASSSGGVVIGEEDELGFRKLRVLYGGKEG